MEYGYFFEGEIVAPVPMCPRFHDVGAWHTLSDDERAEHGWYPCVVHDSRKDQRLHMRLPSVAEFEGGVFEVTYNYIPKGLYQVMEERLEYLQSAFNAVVSKPRFHEFRHYTTKDLPAIEDALKGEGDVVWFESGLVVEMLRVSAARLRTELLHYKQQCLRVRYETQCKIKNATSPEEVVQVCVNSGFDQME